LKIEQFPTFKVSTWTLTSDLVIWHTVVHYSSTSTCIPSFVEIGRTFGGRKYRCIPALL